VVDHEAAIRHLLRACLETNGYGVVEAATGDEGIGAARRCRPAAVLLDMGLPDMSGLLALKRMRDSTPAPVLVVSDRDGETDKIDALDCGASDYITKPFTTGELMARLRVTQRHYTPPDAQSGVFASGRLRVDLDSRLVTVTGRKVNLTPTEYSLLRLFIRNAGKVLTHRRILSKIWGRNELDNKDYVRVYLAYLRGKLEANPAKPELLITEPGVGYRLVVGD